MQCFLRNNNQEAKKFTQSIVNVKDASMMGQAAMRTTPRQCQMEVVRFYRISIVYENVKIYVKM